MIYWHLQMHLPYGEGEEKINPREMLQEPAPVIGTGEWNSQQCYNFKNLNGTGISSGTIILVREGAAPVALCRLLDNRAFKDARLEDKYLNVWYRYVEVLEFYEGDDYFPQPRGTLQRLISPRTNSYQFIEKLHKRIIIEKEMKSYTDILEYKKQIILQGPPGTGKTRLAKEIAAELIIGSNNFVRPLILSNHHIGQLLKDVTSIKSVAGNATYKLINVDEQNQTVMLEKSTDTTDTTKFSEIIEFYKDSYFNNSFDDNNSRRAAALANYIHENIKVAAKLEESDQFKIIQFHPSYTYEDFVRGIVVNPNDEGTGVSYKPENKILGKFASAALENLKDSHKPAEIVSNEEWVRGRIKEFQKYLEEKLSKDEKIWLTSDVAYITRVTNETIRYKGDNWKIDGGVPYADLEKMFLAKITSLSEIRQLDTLTLSAKSNTTYWQKFLDLFKKYLHDINAIMPTAKGSDKVRLKKYVLVIDEINRANLTSVLGELIYALEYRGDQVDSIYKDEKGDGKLILPSNLYIIGTMNTADRSVGHIDYAIRRRFAFIDVLPKKLQSGSGMNFDDNLFNQVNRLFTTDDYKTRSEYLSSEFDPRDVALGHSYFIQIIGENGEKTPENMHVRLAYEIIPILNEYVKDGVLKSSAISEIEKLKVSI